MFNFVTDQNEIGIYMKVLHGGNGKVEINNGIAKKILKRNLTKEKKNRFKTEIDILLTLKKLKIDNVVIIDKYDLSTKEPYYTMKALSGNSDDLLEITKQNVLKTINLLLPIIKTLKILSEQEEPIYHRDLKPANILYEKNKEGSKLFLTDFGCAYLKTNNEDRITNEFRAVGAMAFRAPEYQYGKVNDVNEKGDIFSIGKLLWYFINGIKSDIFPYTLWFPNEYNLSKRYPNCAYINDINMIIASCVHHDANRRCGYEELITSLENLLNKPTNIESIENLDLIELEKENELRKVEEVSICESMLNVFMNDFTEVFTHIKSRYPSSTTLSSFKNKFTTIVTKEEVINNVCHRNTDCPIINVNLSRFSFSSRMHPAKNNKHTNLVYPFIAFGFRTTNQVNKEKSFNIILAYIEEKGTVYIKNETVVDKKVELVNELLDNSIDFMTK